MVYDKLVVIHQHPFHQVVLLHHLKGGNKK
jgi:hypothetical protein